MADHGKGDRRLAIGLDIGTTSTVGILIDTDGGTLAKATRESDLSSPHAGWAEADPAQWRRNAMAVLGELAAAARAPIGAVGVTGMLPALVLLDAEGRPLRPSIQQNDARTEREIAEMAGDTDVDAFFAMTGQGITQQLVGPRLRWLERHEPDVFGRIDTVLGAYDYINFELTGVRSVERNWALEAGLLDAATGAPDPALLALAHCQPDWLPAPRDGHEVIGAITDAVAAETGLAAGTPVVAGVADHVTSAFVAGVIDEGDILIKFGGAGDILLATDRPRPDPRLFLDLHNRPGLWLTNGCMAASGSVLKWIAREIAGGRYSYAELDEMAAAVPPGAGGLVLLPYFLGEKTPLHDPNARGTLVGLGLHHKLGHIWRAALEAVVFGFRHHIEVFTEMGLEVRRVRSSNGGSESAVWLQIAADVLQMPVTHVAGHPGSCLGAAYTAAVGTGMIEGWDRIGDYVSEGRTYAPDADAKAAYDHAYGLYREVYERLRDLYPRLAGP